MPFLRALVLAVLALPALAQQPRIAILSPSEARGYYRPLEEALAREGFVEGRNVRILRAYAFAEGNPAQDLVRQHPDVIVTEGTVLTRAVRALAGSTPVVFAGASDPVASGLVASLARPGGTTTGVTNIECDLAKKRAQVLREVFPRAKRLAMLQGATPPGVTLCAIAPDILGDKSVDFQVFRDETGSDREMRAFVQHVLDGHPEGLALTAMSGDADDPTARILRELTARVPLVADGDGWTADVALVTLIGDRDELQGRVASQVARILRGVRVADVPVENVTRFVLSVNLRRASQLGVTIPQAILLRADRIVE